jgi:hypothetical protein
LGTSAAAVSPVTAAPPVAEATLVNVIVSVTAVTATSPATAASLHWKQSGSQCLVATATLINLI